MSAEIAKSREGPNDASLQIDLDVMRRIGYFFENFGWVTAEEKTSAITRCLRADTIDQGPIGEMLLAEAQGIVSGLKEKFPEGTEAGQILAQLGL